MDNYFSVEKLWQNVDKLYSAGKRDILNDKDIVQRIKNATRKFNDVLLNKKLDNKPYFRNFILENGEFVIIFNYSSFLSSVIRGCEYGKKDFFKFYFDLTSLFLGFNEQQLNYYWKNYVVKYMTILNINGENIVNRKKKVKAEEFNEAYSYIMENNKIKDINDITKYIDAELRAYRAEYLNNPETIWVSRYGDGYGYDILGNDRFSGKDKLIEVKSNNMYGSSIHLTPNEKKVVGEAYFQGIDYYIYLYQYFERKIYAGDMTYEFAFSDQYISDEHYDEEDYFITFRKFKYDKDRNIFIGNNNDYLSFRKNDILDIHDSIKERQKFLTR